MISIRDIDDSKQKILRNKFLNRLSSIEFVVSEKCQNQCEYCYRVKKHNNSSINYIDPNKIELFINNFKEMFNVDDHWLSSRNTELFGGDGLLDYEATLESLKILKKYFKHIIVPTNGRLLQELTFPDIEKLVNASDGKFIASISVDGIVSDNQRKLSRYGRMLSYDENINYDKLIKIAKKYNWGFHPMFSFKHIDKWLDTVKFFFDKKIYPYLLEVRHPLDKETAIHAITELSKIKKFLNNNITDKKILKKFNTINLSLVPRGLSCSALTSVSIMPNGDIPFCHRVIDEPWVMGNVLEKKYDISKIVMLKSGFNQSNHPSCMNCSIRRICNKLCSGANYEYWGDPWIPIESICKYIKLKTFIFYKLFNQEWEEIEKYINIDTLREEVYEIYSKEIVYKIIDDVHEMELN